MTDAAQLLRESAAVLLDFDGPVTPLMPAPANLLAADAARRALEQHGTSTPAEIATTSDHLAVIRWTGTYAPDALRYVNDACALAEMDSAKTCTPTPGAHAFLASLHAAGTPVVIVSNNEGFAIRIYLDRHHLTPYVRDVIGRPFMRPDLMKPHPHIVERALEITGSAPGNSVLIGDSVSDIEVAKATGVRSIGYAKTRRRGVELRDVGADAVIDRMADLMVGDHTA